LPLLFDLVFTQRLHLSKELRTDTSGNRTPGSRFYSDLLDTLADFVCIHQLVLKTVQSLPVQWLVPINAH